MYNLHNRISGEQYTFHSAGVKSYPDLPASFGEETLVSYVYEYEKSYFHNTMVTKYRNELTDAGLGVEEDETQVEHVGADITIVYIWFFTSTSVLHDGAHPVAGDGAGAASYAIDETGIVRAETRYDVSDEGMPDPIEDGTPSSAFDQYALK